MASKNNFKLQQTKSTFRMIGEVARLNDKSFRENVSAKGNEYRSIRFQVKTSKTNQHPVELFGMETEFVYPFSAELKKAGKPASLKHPFAKRNELPDGYNLIGIRVNLDGEERNLVEYDAAKFIKENLHDGDTVWVSGEIEFSEFTDKQGNTKKQTRYVIKTINKNKAIDFDAPDFEETAGFTQQLVIIDTEKDDDTGKVLVNGYTVQYADKFRPAVGLVIDPEMTPKLADKFLGLQFGDWLNVKGNIRNESIVVEAPEEEEEDEWGSITPKGFENKGIRETISELLVTGVVRDSFEGAKYNEDDFAPDAADEAFGGGANVEDPFDDDEDDVPFRS